MNNIYMIIPSEGSGGLVWDPLQESAFYEAIGWRPFNSEWVAQRARFLDDVHERLNAGVVSPGGLVATEGLARDLLKKVRAECELLPMNVGGRRWELLNVLSTVREFDRSRSDVLADSDGRVFWVHKLSILRSEAAWDIFTLSASNRASIFVTDRFMNAARELGMKGVNFKRVGELTS
jgi:hypothetical protein